MLEAARPRPLAHNWLGQPAIRRSYSIMAVMVWVQLGYPVVMFMAALQRVDPELYEAADLDGAGWLQRFRAITVTIIRPEIFVVAITCTIAALKVFGPIYVLTRGGPGNATLVPATTRTASTSRAGSGLRRDDRDRAHRGHRRLSFVFLRAQTPWNPRSGALHEAGAAARRGPRAGVTDAPRRHKRKTHRTRGRLGHPGRRHPRRSPSPFPSVVLLNAFKSPAE